MLSEIQASNIAASAMRLYEALQAHGADDDGQADRWVGQAMMAIVMTETDPAEPLRTDHPLIFGDPQPAFREERARFGKSNLIGDMLLTETDPAELPRDLPSAEQARWGNVSPDDRDGITPAILEQLSTGPEPGHGMRLVRLATTGAAGEEARREVMRWVRDHVPGAGPIRAVNWAGRAPSGAASYLYPVYLAVYELKGEDST
jgi:hypothetical protein